jgi:hypothetical protein
VVYKAPLYDVVVALDLRGEDFDTAIIIAAVTDALSSHPEGVAEFTAEVTGEVRRVAARYVRLIDSGGHEPSTDFIGY